MYRIAIVACLFLAACSNKPVTTDQESPETPKTGTSDGVLVRYKNISTDTFKVLQTVTTAGKTYTFENIAPGQFTNYVTVPVAYATHFAKVVIGRDSFVFQPISQAGQQAYNNGYLTLDLNLAPDETGRRQLVFPGTGSLYEDYAAEEGIIDNLFTSVNNRDWRKVNSYYTANTLITDEANPGFKGAPAEYFQRLFTVAGVNRISVVEQQASNDAIYVMALASRGRNNAENPLCISFVIQNNQIIEQHMVLCNQ